MAVQESGDEGAFSARRRHLLLLESVQKQLVKAQQAWEQHATLDLFAEDLRLAHETLGQITGSVSSDDVLGAIFSTFCIGK